MVVRSKSSRRRVSIHQTLQPAEIDTLVDLLGRVEPAARSCPTDTDNIDTDDNH